MRGDAEGRRETHKSTPMVETLSSSARKSSSVNLRSKLDFPTLELPIRRIYDREIQNDSGSGSGIRWGSSRASEGGKEGKLTLRFGGGVAARRRTESTND